MKSKNSLRFSRMIFLGLALAMAPLSMAMAASDDTPALPQMKPAAAKLSSTAREVVRLAASGVPEETIKAYVENSPGTFNLTADNIINLQGVGVSSGVMTEMLQHDKMLRDNASAYAANAYAISAQAQTAAPSSPYPPGTPAMQAPDTGYSATATDEPDYYNGLSPYGNWNYLAGYGWCWQPYASLSYNAYPWGLLGYGGWYNWPGRGWCWFPNSRFNRFDRFARFDRFNGSDRFNHFDRGNNFNRFTTVGGNRFGGNFAPTGSVGFNRAAGMNRSVSSFHSFSPAMGHGGGGGHFSGGHAGGAGGFHR